MSHQRQSPRGSHLHAVRAQHVALDACAVDDSAGAGPELPDVPRAAVSRQSAHVAREHRPRRAHGAVPPRGARGGAGGGQVPLGGASLGARRRVVPPPALRPGRDDPGAGAHPERVRGEVQGDGATRAADHAQVRHGGHDSPRGGGRRGRRAARRRSPLEPIRVRRGVGILGPFGSEPPARGRFRGDDVRAAARRFPVQSGRGVRRLRRRVRRRRAPGDDRRARARAVPRRAAGRGARERGRPRGVRRRAV